MDGRGPELIVTEETSESVRVTPLIQVGTLIPTRARRDFAELRLSGSFIVGLPFRMRSSKRPPPRFPLLCICRHAYPPTHYVARSKGPTLPCLLVSALKSERLSRSPAASFAAQCTLHRLISLPPPPSPYLRPLTRMQGCLLLAHTHVPST